MASANTGSGVAQHSRPLFGKISSMSMPSRAWSARRSSIVSPLLLRRSSSGSMRLWMWRLCSGFSNDCCSCTVAVFAPRLTSCGRLPSVIIHSEPSSRRSMRGMRSRNCGSMYSARYVLGSWAWQSAETMKYLSGIVGAGGARPARRPRACPGASALRGDSVIVIEDRPLSFELCSLYERLPRTAAPASSPDGAQEAGKQGIDAPTRRMPSRSPRW